MPRGGSGALFVWWFASLLVAGPACFDPLVSADAVIACGGDGDCPDGLVCAGFLERCVAASGGDRTAPRVVSSTLSARRLGGDGVLVVTVQPDEPTLDGAVLQVADRTVVLVADPDLSDPGAPGRALTASLPVGDLGDGAYAVSAILVDFSGNVGVAVLGSIEVDTSPPGIEQESVEVVVTQPTGTAPVDDPPLAPGGRIDVAFRLDDLNATVERVALENDADEGSDSDIVLALIDQTSNAYAFGTTFDIATTTGPHQLVVTAVDDVGNRIAIAIDTIDVVGAIEAVCVAVDAAGTPVCTDADGDGFFGPGEGCAAGQASDCDDTRAAVHPGAVEVAGDAVDDDCDGDALSYDEAEAAGLAVFVKPGAPLNAPATRVAPSGDLVGVVGRLPPGGVAYVQQGTFALGETRLVPTGSIVGGLDAAWAASGDKTELRANATAGIVDFSGAGAPTTALVRGLAIRGGWCHAIDGQLDHTVEIVDVHMVLDETLGCNQWYGLFDGDMRAADVLIDMRRPDAPDVRPISVDTLTLIDSNVIVESGDDAQGVLAAAGRVVRSRFEVACQSGEAVNIDGAVIASQVVIDAVDNGGFFGSAAVVAFHGDVVHNDIIARTDTDAVLIGVHTLHGLVASNAISVRGSASVAVRIDDFEAPSVRVHGNAIDVGGTTCALRSGRSDRTCLSLDTCAPCTTHGDNAVAPATPPPVSAIDLGAPSTSAVGLEGACRGATAPAGAR
jgi:hypothetical protein